MSIQDEDMMVRLTGIDLKSKEVKYHHTCRKDYLNKAQASSEREGSQKTEAHRQAFTQLKVNIHEKLIETPDAELLQTLYQRYIDYLGESSYDARCLCDKIIGEYKDNLKTCKHANRVIVYNVTLSPEVAIRKSQFDEHLKESALHLRSAIIKMMIGETMYHIR